MSYYHVIVETLEQDKNKNFLKHFEFDLQDITALENNFILPYLSKGQIFIDGRFISSNQVRSLKVKQTQSSAGETVNLANNNVPRNVIFTYTKQSVINNDHYSGDVTRDLIMKNSDIVNREVSNSQNETNSKNDKTIQKIFISHASKDVEIVEEFIELLEFIGLKQDQIFCTSLAEYGISLGEDFLATLKNEISSNTLVIFIISQEFYKSPVCLCEMGATWALSQEHFPVIVPPLSFKDIKGVIPLTQGLLINDKMQLNLLKEKLENCFSIEDKKNLLTWERRRDKMIERISTKI